MKKSATKASQYSAPKPTSKAAVVTQLSRNPAFGKQAIKTAIDRPVEPSFLTIDMVELESLIEESPAINAAKIVDLHSRISAGDYRIDSQSLADKFIDLESALDKH